MSLSLGSFRVSCIAVALLRGYRMLAGRSRATWVVQPSTWAAARAWESGRWNQRWRMGPFLPRSTASRGGGEAFRAVLLDGLSSLACPGFFRLRGAFGCFGQVVGLFTAEAGERSGRVRVQARKQVMLPLRLDRIEGRSLLGLAAVGLQILRA
jgi:hypothetical protein